MHSPPCRSSIPHSLFPIPAFSPPTMTALSTGYDPKTFESRLYAQWESSGVFAPAGDGPAYTILLPPPNVTGPLPMGHAFQHTLMDALGPSHRPRALRPDRKRVGSGNSVLVRV